MRLNFRPREDSFYEFFTKAGINIERASVILTELKQPDADMASISARLTDAEHANDEVTHALLRKLHSSFITPFDRGDVHRLGSSLDDVMDHMEASGTLAHLYGISDLPPLPSEMHAQIDVIAGCAQLTVAALPELKSLAGLDRYCVEINRLENEGDRAYRMLLVHLFNGTYDALTVLKLKEVADELEETVDAFEQVAHVVETILVKES